MSSAFSKLEEGYENASNLETDLEDGGEEEVADALAVDLGEGQETDVVLGEGQETDVDLREGQET